MVMKEDLKRIFDHAEKASIIGTLIGDYIEKWSKFSLSKIILFLGIIICSIIFIVFGILNRKKNSK